MTPLSPARSRLFVIAFVAVIFGLSLLATVLITKGWNDEALQQRVRQQEAERNAAEPRL